MRCAGQLRFAPDGTVIGIDMNIALMMAESLGYERSPVAELLAVAEDGVLEGMKSIA